MSKSMFTFIVVCIFIGIALAFIIAPFAVVKNKKILKQMDKKIEEFDGKRFSSEEEKEQTRRELKKVLVAMKAQIIADKKSTEQAADKINIL